MQEQHEQHDQIVQLLLKKVNNEQLTPEEETQLNDWVNQSPHNKKVFDDVTNAPLLEKEVKALIGYDEVKMWRRIDRGIHGRSRKAAVVDFFQSVTGKVAVAVALTLLTIGAYFIINRPAADKPLAKESLKPVTPIDIAPGMEGAILKLGDGTTIVLDNAANGKLATGEDVAIVKTDGAIVYSDPAATTTAKVSYNTMTTPAGRLYRVVLADNTVAWLNSSSSITYPTAFNSNQRKVTITGEVFFEVAKNAERPFIVDVDGKQEIEVLGTHFNVNAYDDEKIIRTTLLEGKVRLSTTNVKSGVTQSAVLTPGQQSQLNAGVLSVGNNINTEEVMAWKNGSFQFEGTDIETIMRQVKRWYAVDVKFEGAISPRKFYVDPVPRTVPVSKLLKWLEDTKEVRFKIDESRITVLPPL